MSRDEIIRMAREAGFSVIDLDGTAEVLCCDAYHLQTEDIERFAVLVAAAEREACAKVCESEGLRVDAGWASCAYAIRARGE